MIQKTNSKKNLKKSNGNVHVSDEIKIKDNSEIKSLKRKLTKKADDNESKKKKINKKNNSVEESNEVFEESTTNSSPKKGKKAKLALKEDVNAGDSDDEQGKGSTGCQEEEPDKNEDANHHNNVQIKKSVACLACGDKGHKTANCSLLEDMEVVECCSKCLSPDHVSDGCSEVQGYARVGDCRNCQEPNHYSSNCEKECNLCKNNTDGHMRKDCPMADLCRNCEESNHPSWTCEKRCKYCSDNLDDHVRKDCPLGVSKYRGRGLGRGSSRGGGFRGRGSSRGGEFRGRGSSRGGGFRGRGSSRGGGFSGPTCFNCNEVGHTSRVCPKRGF